MAKLIKLTLEGGDNVYINANFIQFFLREKDWKYTRMNVFCGSGRESTFFILETPEQIQQLVNN